MFHMKHCLILLVMSFPVFGNEYVIPRIDGGVQFSDGRYIIPRIDGGYTFSDGGSAIPRIDGGYTFSREITPQEATSILPDSSLDLDSLWEN